MPQQDRYGNITPFDRFLINCRIQGIYYFIAIVATIVSITGITPLRLLELSKTNETRIHVIALFSLLGTSWVFLLVREFIYSRKARYAEALTYYHMAFHKLRDAWWSLQSNSIDQHLAENIKNTIQSSVADFASAFSVITGVHCRACIKRLCYRDVDESSTDDHDERSIFTIDYCRDISTKRKQKNKLDSRDFVTENTDFLALLRNPNMKAFFSNDLPHYPGYQNSHWTPDIWRDRKFDYVSTMVWPIRKLLNPSGPSDPDKDYIGFICVDSSTRGVFIHRYDLWLGASYADMLYTVLKVLFAKTDNIQTAHTTQNSK